MVNPPVPQEDIRFAMTPEGMGEREARLRIARQFSSVVLEAAEDYLRELQERVVQKVDPERADRIRRMSYGHQHSGARAFISVRLRSRTIRWTRAQVACSLTCSV